MCMSTPSEVIKAASTSASSMRSTNDALSDRCCKILHHLSHLNSELGVLTAASYVYDASIVRAAL